MSRITLIKKHTTQNRMQNQKKGKLLWWWQSHRSSSWNLRFMLPSTREYLRHYRCFYDFIFKFNVSRKLRKPLGIFIVCHLKVMFTHDAHKHSKFEIRTLRMSLMPLMSLERALLSNSTHRSICLKLHSMVIFEKILNVKQKKMKKMNEMKQSKFELYAFPSVRAFKSNITLYKIRQMIQNVKVMKPVMFRWRSMLWEVGQFALRLWSVIGDRCQKCF